MMSGTAITPLVLLLPSLLLSGCAGGKTAGEHIADMPSWMGGLPEGTHRAGARLNTMRGWQSALKKRRDRRRANPNSSGVFLTSPHQDGPTDTA